MYPFANDGLRGSPILGTIKAGTRYGARDLDILRHKSYQFVPFLAPGELGYLTLCQSWRRPSRATPGAGLALDLSVPSFSKLSEPGWPPSVSSSGTQDRLSERRTYRPRHVPPNFILTKTWGVPKGSCQAQGDAYGSAPEHTRLCALVGIDTLEQPPMESE